MKINKLQIAILLLFAVFISSCELDLYPESNLSDADFWKTDDNFEQACNRLYTFLEAEGEPRVFRFKMDDTRSDYAIGKVGNDISSGTRVAPSSSSDWSLPYQLIFTANNILEKAEGVDLDDVDRWTAEAKFFRAYAYYELAIRYGDVPLILNVLDIDAPEFDQPRTSRELVIKQIYEDLDFAADNLPNFIELGEDQYGRVSRSAALALKSRVALYFGTHQKYHQWGDPNHHLSIAISSAESAMNEGHELYSDESDNPYYNLFQMKGEGFANKENIFVIIYGENLSNHIKAHNIGRRMENGENNVSRSMVDLYLCLDGLPYDKSPLAEHPEKDHLSIFKNKDPRMDASLFKEGDPFGNPSTYNQLTTSYCITFFAPRKYSIVEDWEAGRSYVDIALIRYAEVLLNYAEAKFEMNGSISNSELDKSINLLRERVGMPKLTNEFVTSNGLDMLTEIRRERSVELAQEATRYNDIIRWRIAHEVLPKPILGATYFPELYREGPNVNDDGLVIAQRGETRHFNINRDYLYPIPVNEISLSGGAIEQNPGW